MGLTFKESYYCSELLELGVLGHKDHALRVALDCGLDPDVEPSQQLQTVADGLACILVLDHLLGSDFAEESVVELLLVGRLLDHDVHLVEQIGQHGALVLHQQRQTQHEALGLALYGRLRRCVFGLAFLRVVHLHVLGCVLGRGCDAEPNFINGFRVSLGFLRFLEEGAQGGQLGVVELLVVDLADDDWVR